jgi:hypothetical protein
MTNQLPANITEFNELTAVIFALLYDAHPLPKTLEPSEIADILGGSPTGTMPSGRTFNDVFAHTLSWLVHEKYIYSNGVHPRERAQLTDKALTAMNVVPPSLGRSRGSELIDATKQASTEAGRGKLSGLVAAVVEGITKAVLSSQ